MNTKYGVLNPNTGEVDFCATEQEAQDLFFQRAVELAQAHFHGNSYVKVLIDENGVETWTNQDEVSIDKILTAEERKAKFFPSKITEPTQVEVLP
jgi:hypothetical protein